MKKIDTAYISNKKADFNEIKHIIENLFTENSEERLCLFDTSKKNQNYQFIPILRSLKMKLRILSTMF
ncbi:MAG: hypothetical protein SPH94_00395 [Fusobacterium necrophorum]|nr:hypothetical protein [Fusobacterium necrophorum]MDY6171640.1 hypothetical protein [Fusobacterium necrophorum]